MPRTARAATPPFAMFAVAVPGPSSVPQHKQPRCPLTDPDVISNVYRRPEVQTISDLSKSASCYTSNSSQGLLFFAVSCELGLIETNPPRRQEPKNSPNSIEPCTSLRHCDQKPRRRGCLSARSSGRSSTPGCSAAGCAGCWVYGIFRFRGRQLTERKFLLSHLYVLQHRALYSNGSISMGIFQKIAVKYEKGEGWHKRRPFCHLWTPIFVAPGAIKCRSWVPACRNRSDDNRHCSTRHLKRTNLQLGDTQAV